MDQTFQPEVREGDDDEDVDGAGKPIKYKFEYKTGFAHLPRLLTIQLSRFSFDYSRGVPIKHNHRVEFPQVLNLSHLTEPAKEGQPPRPAAMYHLRGILIHQGATANSGHYYSIIRQGAYPSDRW